MAVKKKVVVVGSGRGGGGVRERLGREAGTFWDVWTYCEPVTDTARSMFRGKSSRVQRMNWRFIIIISLYH